MQVKTDFRKIEIFKKAEHLILNMLPKRNMKDVYNEILGDINNAITLNCGEPPIL